MNSTSFWKSLLTLGCLIFSTATLAITPEEEEGLKKCIKPKFRDFAPIDKSEVEAGSEISFHVSHNSESSTIGAEAKGQKLILDIKDRKKFYEVKARLPAELSNTFARISLHAKAVDGDCIGQDGWLLKIGSKEK